MNYLELAQALWLESGSGGTAPTSVLAQKGEKQRLVSWVKQADLRIQSMFSDWNFLWARNTLNTVSGTATYSLASGVQEIDRTAVFANTDLIDVAEYLDVKGEQADSSSGKPYRVVLLPNRTLRLEPVPDAIYTITYDGWSTPIALAADEDVSLIPAQFHYAIVGKALTLYAEYENAPEIMAKGQAMFAEWMPPLKAQQLPGKRHLHNQAEGGDMVIEVE